MAAVASRKFFEELGILVGKPVRVEDTGGKVYDGVLLGYDSNTMTICLGDVPGEQGTKIHRMFIYGSTVARVSASERQDLLRRGHHSRNGQDTGQRDGRG